MAAENTESSWLEPYISMRASYIILKPTGHQDVYLAPGGVIATKLSEDKLYIDEGHAFGIKLAFGGSTDVSAISGSLRVEAEYSDNGSFVTPITSSGGNADFATQNKTMLGNAYYSLDTGTMLSPYVGAGLGFSHFSSSGDFSSGAFNGQLAKAEYTFSWQAGAGLGLDLTNGVTIDLGYRYSDLGTFKGGVDISRFTASGSTVLNSVVLHNDVEMKFKAQEILLGVRYRL